MNVNLKCKMSQKNLETLWKFKAKEDNSQGKVQ